MCTYCLLLSIVWLGEPIWDPNPPSQQARKMMMMGEGGEEEKSVVLLEAEMFDREGRKECDVALNSYVVIE